MNFNISQWKDARMTPAEKNAVALRLHSYSAEAILADKHASGFSWYMRIIGTSFATLILMASGVSYAADKSLPGDIFYPVKINVSEKIKSVSITNREEKMIWEKTRVERRITEMEELISNDALTPEKKEIATTQLTKQLETLNTSVKEIADDETKGDVAKHALSEVALTLEKTIDINTQTVAELIDPITTPIASSADMIGGVSELEPTLIERVLETATLAKHASEDKSTSSEVKDSPTESVIIDSTATVSKEAYLKQ